ncbi:hypothetical protein EG328_011904 [Venturia inaequalis]|uniref:Tail specific protease domain-containing protein n=1 Tax=Venturia inaequalis TaxID=5025 RepID=A0A8H3V5D6_VENIN|nr:hypothetical protein EG328_011904 [Venturia inaequalis]
MHFASFFLILFASVLAIADDGTGLGAYILAGLGGPSISPSQTLSTVSPPSNPTACGDVINDKDDIVTAKLAYQCLTSVPFNPAVATRFLEYYNVTLQFQSTLAYLKTPDSGYKQPKVDLIAGINKIQEYANTPGAFPNQYAFEATLQRLIYMAHDGHLALIAGILSAFNFGSPYALASVSKDGKELPKVYLWDDIIDSEEANHKWNASAITHIDGRDVIDYLTDFANLNSVGGIEPHADWNQLMNTPTTDILGFFSVFSGSATFFVNDTITFTLENNTVVGPIPWLAIYNNPGDTGPLTTGGDFYNFFVLGQYPASYDPDSATDSAADLDTDPVDPEEVSTGDPTWWGNPAYPDNPDIVQPDLSTSGGGFVTGYFLNASSIGVLSIPSFLEYGDAVGTFSDTVGEFIRRSKAAGLEKIVIDLQHNDGGAALLAHDTFKHFFPNLEPFGGSRMRAHPIANILGKTITKYWNGLKRTTHDYFALLADEWLSSVRINADTGRNFTSWEKFYGPHEAYGDTFTTTQRLNLSSTLFDAASLSGFVPFGYAYRTPAVSTPPYEAKNIVILTDGICSSTCAMFVEMMQHRANVSTVVVGGRPINGPMQTVGGSRGARVYSGQILNNNIALAQNIDNATESTLPDRSDTGMYITYSSINLRDQVRKNSDTPLQFSYEAAHCRIFWTFHTVNNYTNLWKHAAKATWTDHSLCVEGSRGFASEANDTTNASPSASSPKSTATGNTTQSAFDIPSIAILPGETPDPIPNKAGAIVPVKRKTSLAIGPLCTVDSAKGTDSCSTGTICKLIIDGCTTTKPSKPNKRFHCVPTCNPSPNTLPCPDGDEVGGKPCTPGKTVVQKGFSRKTGFCAPPGLVKGQPCASPAGGQDKDDQGVNLAGGALVRRVGGLR